MNSKEKDAQQKNYLKLLNCFFKNYLRKKKFQEQVIFKKKLVCYAN